MASQEAGRRGSFPPHPQDVAILAAAAGVFPSAEAVGNSTFIIDAGNGGGVQSFEFLVSSFEFQKVSRF
jgi:hypothetical protein